MPGPHVRTAILTSDGQVKATAGQVYWVVASAGATGGAATLDDSTDDSGTEMLSIVVGANTGPHFLDFSNAPIRFDTAIYADIGGTNVTLTVGYR